MENPIGDEEIKENEASSGKEKDTSSTNSKFEEVEEPIVEQTVKEIINCPEWNENHRHIFIMSSAGKPVYSRYGSEDKLVTIFGIMQALVSFVQDDEDTIESIHFGSNVLVFSSKGPIIFVAVSNRRDSVEFLSNMLKYVYNQIVSVLTLSQVTSILERRKNYDLRRLLTGSERLLDSLLTFAENEPDFLLHSVSCLPMDPVDRENISLPIIQCCSKIKNLVFAILVGNNRLITLVRKKKYDILPSDLHLIFNLVSASEWFKTSESWIPICLPNFNPNGYLHCHVSYLTEDCQACLLLLTVDQELFYDLSKAKEKITEKLIKNKSITVIKESMKKCQKAVDSYCNQEKFPDLRHFLCKYRKQGQILAPNMPEPYNRDKERKDLIFQYQQLHSTMNTPGHNLQLLFKQLPTEKLMGWVSDKLELYLTFDPLTSKKNATEIGHKLSEYIRKEEDHFFMLNTPCFY